MNLLGRMPVELGQVSTFAGGEKGEADGVGAAAQFSSPGGIAVDSAGTVYVSDTGNHRIRTISREGKVSTLAGSGKEGSGDGRGAAAQFSSPGGIAVDRTGIVYVADTGNKVIRKITPEGVVSTLDIFSSLRLRQRYGKMKNIKGIAVDGEGVLYVGEGPTIAKILPTGEISTVAGQSMGFVDGLLESARFSIELDVAVHRTGVVYVSDGNNHRIRKIALDKTKWDRTVSTVVGVDTTFVGGIFAASRIFTPSGIAVDGAGCLYVADNNRIRKILPDGTITTLAGTSRQGDSDGRGSAARFKSPLGLAVDLAGVVYIADTENHRIRKMVIRTFEANDAEENAIALPASAAAAASIAAEATVPPAPEAEAVAVAAPFPNFEGNALTSEARGRLWWQLNQMTCPIREADSHIPFVKAQLNLLYNTTVRTIESYNSKATEAQRATYQKHLRNIFRSAEPSFTCLNDRSVKCAMLFTKMCKDTTPEDEYSNYEEASGKYWTKHWDAPESSPLRIRNLRGLVFQDEHPGCIPSCKNKGIVVLLGEMTLYELIWSYANDLYFIGMPTTVQSADGQAFTPLKFIEHDCEHMEDRSDIEEVMSDPSFPNEFKRDELKRRKQRAIENMNVLKCLQYIRTQPKAVEDAVMLFLFLIVHEQFVRSSGVLEGPLSVEDLTKSGTPIYRLLDPKDMGGFVKASFNRPDSKYDATSKAKIETWWADPDSNGEEDGREDIVSGWFGDQLLLFVEVWNASLLSGAAAVVANEPQNANTIARYDARTKTNAAAWDARAKAGAGGGRRTRRFYSRRSLRRKTQRRRRV